MSDSQTWQVHVDLDATAPTNQDMPAQLERFLADSASIGKAVASLIDRGTGISIGATIVLAADDPGQAVNTAVTLVTAACRDAQIPAGQMREATVCPSHLDPRI